MKTTLTAALIAGALLASNFADAQTAPTRYRGTIAGVSGDMMSVKTTDGRSVDVRLTDKTSIVFAQPIPMSEIKQGDFLAVTSVKRVDGALTAYDVRRMMKPTNPGHRPFDGGANQTMTNATLSSVTVTGTKGRELVLSYEGGSQTVVVADKAAITSLVPGQRAQLVPGSYVNLTAAPESDGKLTARNIEVRKDAPKPPR